MNTHQIEPDGAGWFRVTVIDPNGKSHIRTGFVSELAAQKWVDKCRKEEARREQTGHRGLSD
jgi:hypothetical protein